jgi:hypothetical protein
MKLTIRILLCMAVTAMIATSCGNRKGSKNQNAAPAEPEAVLSVTDRYFQAIDRYFAAEVAPQYAPAAHCITYHDYAAVDDSNPDDIQVLGDFWVENYDVVGDTLMFVSGGNHPGKIHIKKGSDGNYFVPGLDAAGDGSEFLPTAKAIFGDRFDGFQKANSDQDLREQIRKDAISGYVFKNKLGVKYYKDYGWPAVRIPNPEDSSRR